MHKSIGVLLIGLAAMPGKAWADEPWRFSLTPYLWAASLDGSLRTRYGLPEVSFNAGFTDILKNTDFAAMVLGEVGKGRYSALMDLTYLRLSGQGQTPGSGFGGAKLDSSTTVFTFGGAYRFEIPSKAELSAVAGGRMWALDSTLSLEPNLLPGAQFGFDRAWVDPIIGARARYPVDRNWLLEAYADVGGFGVASVLTWQAYGGIDYVFGKRFSAHAGYRYLMDDYRDGGFLWDVNLSGPILGLTINF